MSFLHDSYRGGEKYRVPSASTLSEARTRWTESNGDGTYSTKTGRHWSYLAPHPAEDDFAFEGRRSHAAYINLVAPIVDAYAEAITGNVTRDLLELEQYRSDVDMRGSTWDEFAEDAARWHGLYGYGATVVDAPREVSASSAATASARPYCIFVPPSSWAWLRVDMHGGLDEFAYVDQPFQSDSGDSRQQQVCVRVFRKTDVGIAWEVREGAVAMGKALCDQLDALASVAKDSAGNPLQGMLPASIDEIPVVIGYYKRDTASRTPQGYSIVEDAADVARQIYNALSWANEIHRSAGFPFLVIPQSATGGQLDPSTTAAVGPTKALGYPATTGAPSWVSPSPDSTRELRDHVVFLFALALRTAGLEVAADQSAQVQSGEALRIRSRDFESRAKRFANNQQRWEQQVLALFAKFAGIDGYTANVEYAKRFTLPDPAEDLANALRVLKEIPIEIGIEAKLAMVRRALDAAASASDEDLNAWMDEIRALLSSDMTEFTQSREVDQAARAQKLLSLTGAPEADAGSNDTRTAA